MAALDAIRNKRLLLGLGLAVAVCLAFVAERYFRPGEGEVSREEVRAIGARMRDITFVHGRDGALLWRMRAESAELGADREVVSMSRPEMEYSLEGNQTLTASSAKGEYDRESRTAAFWSGVSGTYGAVRFTAGRMEYAADTESLSLLQGVHVTRGNASIKSSRADLDLETQRVVFSRDAEVELYGGQQ